MKGVSKIKNIKKYITIIFTAFAFLFININGVNANSIIKPENIVFEHSEIKLIPNTWTNYYENVNVNANYIAINHDDIRLVDDKSLGMYVTNSYTPHINETIYHSSEIYNSIDYKIYKIDYSYLSTLRFWNRTGKQLNINSVILLNTSNEIVENINNLTFDINNNEITFNYDLPTDENFSHLELHQDGLLLADNITTNYFEVYNLEYDTKYNFTIFTVDKDGKKSSGISREIALPSDPNLIPSNNIFGLTHTVSDTNVSFNYSLPLDNNFSHLKIYRNNELINDNYQLAEFIDTGLEPETEYNYRFVSVNKMDISNAGYAVTIKTMEENDTVPPAIPTGLETTAMNSGIVLSWNTNNESDLQGYYVYMNGVQMNSKPITNSIYNITNLENGLDYSFTVSAVDTFGNESEQSTNIIGVPDVDNLPIFKLDTKLSSVGSSVENWFSEIWLIVAFATAIPLSFVIAGRIKGLFIA